MNAAVDVVCFLAGVALVTVVVDSAVRTFVLPRAAVSTLTRMVFVSVRMIFSIFARETHTYESRDRVMALYAPVGLLALVGAWIMVLIGAYTLMFHAVAATSWRRAFVLSGSSFFTLGFSVPHGGLPGYILSFTDAGGGLALLALLIAYLPTIYNTFSRREIGVTQLATRAGTPPSAVELIERFHAIGWTEQLSELWATWEAWFAELGETHTSLAVLVFFRSPNPHRSWVTASGAVLDAAALAQSTLAIPWSPQAGLCIRSGYIALREIADFYGISYDPDPAATDPISIDRSEFDEAYERLGGTGVPVRPDRDRAWREFAGWRVNYDGVLLALASLTMAPYAPWSSDRSLRYSRPRVVSRTRVPGSGKARKRKGRSEPMPEG
jgi:hypothetical protein